MELGGRGKGLLLKTFLEECVDHIIYRDYVVNRSFFFFTVVRLVCNSSKERMVPLNKNAALLRDQICKGEGRERMCRAGGGGRGSGV